MNQDRVGLDGPPTAKEFVTHCALADLVRRCIHFPAGEARDVVTGARLKRMGTARGWPDLMFFCIDGMVCFLELKRRGQELSEEQRRLAVFLIEAGHNYLCTDDFDEAKPQLIAWRTLRAKSERS